MKSVLEIEMKLVPVSMIANWVELSRMLLDPYLRFRIRTVHQLLLGRSRFRLKLLPSSLQFSGVPPNVTEDSA